MLAAGLGFIALLGWVLDLPRLASRLRTPDGKEVAVLRFRVEKGGGLYGLPHLVSAFAYQWEPEFGTF